MNRGMFIVLEGLDGSGKSTQVQRLKTAIEATGQEVVLTRAPGGTDMGQKIRDIILTSQETITEQAEIALLMADHYQRVEEIIMPALDRGAVVIADRYYDSTYAYQSAGKGISKLFIDGVRDALGKLVEPDIRFYVRISPETAVARTSARTCDDHNVFDNAKIEFRHKVMAGFDDRFLKQDETAVVVDGEQDVDVVATAIWGHYAALRAKLDTMQHLPPQVDYGQDDLVSQIFKQMQTRTERHDYHVNQIRSLAALLSTDHKGEILQGYLAALIYHATHSLDDVLVENTNWSHGGLQRRYGEVLLSQFLELPDSTDLNVIRPIIMPEILAFHQQGLEVSLQEMYVYGRRFAAFRSNRTVQRQDGTLVKQGQFLPLVDRHPNFTDLAVEQGLRKQ